MRSSFDDSWFLKRLLGPLIIGLAVVLSLLFIEGGKFKKSGCNIGLVFIRVLILLGA